MSISVLLLYGYVYSIRFTFVEFVIWCVAVPAMVFCFDPVEEAEAPSGISKVTIFR